MDSNFRPLTLAERQLLDALLAPVFPGRDQLLEQVSACRVRPADDDGCLAFSVPAGLIASDVKYRVPTEAEYVDSDGSTVHLLLHVAEGRLFELEMWKENGTRILSKPDPSQFQVFAPK